MDTKTLLKNLDVRQLLDEYNIHYDESGDNISEGWIGTQCPFCNDHLNHLGINLLHKTISCWICGVTGGLYDFIRKKERIDYGAFLDALSRFQDVNSRIDLSRPEKRQERRSRSVLPEKFKSLDPYNLPRLVKKYFDYRELPLSLIKRYRVGWCQTGRYALKLVVPIYMRGRLVSFQAIDMTGKAHIKKDTCPDDLALIPKKDLLYGIDEIKNQIIVVEGIIDKWKIGMDGIALLGKKISGRQMIILCDLADNIGGEIKIVLDADALYEAEKLAGELYRSVKLIELERRDPDDPGAMNRDFIREVLKC